MNCCCRCSEKSQIKSVFTPKKLKKNDNKKKQPAEKKTGRRMRKDGRTIYTRANCFSCRFQHSGGCKLFFATEEQKIAHDLICPRNPRPIKCEFAERGRKKAYATEELMKAHAKTCCKRPGYMAHTD